MPQPLVAALKQPGEQRLDPLRIVVQMAKQGGNLPRPRGVLQLREGLARRLAVQLGRRPPRAAGIAPNRDSKGICAANE